MRVRIALLVSAILTLAAIIILAACSGGGNGDISRSSNIGTVNLTISDPSTCSAPQGPYSNVYVTVAGVKIHQSATAGPDDAGWVDLTPNLTPTQIDLLGIANNNCFLASLGSNVRINAGNYQQIRVILLDNSKASQVTNNKCGSAANCVILAADPSNPQPLQLSSESQTGIKIAPGQFAGGQFTVVAGEARDLNIDFNACASIVIQGNSGYRLKPVLHAGEVSLTASSISGRVVDSTMRVPISGGKVIVALEQVDTATGIERVIMETVTDSTGNFVFCPVPAGTYDVVAVGINDNNVQYAATVTTGVQPGNAISQLLLFAQTAPGTASAHITGQVTTANASNGGTSADISLAALQTIVGTSSNVLVTIPQAAASSATLSLATTPATSCPANTNCATYDMQLPAIAPYVGTFSANPAWTQQPTPSPDFTLDALAFVPNSGSTADCTPPEQRSPTPIAVTAGTSTKAPDLNFTGCQ